MEVKTAFLRAKEGEKNIITVEKAIEQAKENFRINQERFKEQVATTTDVLNAQTLLSDTLTNYFNALYDFKISNATLFRAMGQEVIVITSYSIHYAKLYDFMIHFPKLPGKMSQACVNGPGTMRGLRPLRSESRPK